MSTQSEQFLNYRYIEIYEKNNRDQFMCCLEQVGKYIIK